MMRSDVGSVSFACEKSFKIGNDLEQFFGGPEMTLSVLLTGRKNLTFYFPADYDTYMHTDECTGRNILYIFAQRSG